MRVSSEAAALCAAFRTGSKLDRFTVVPSSGASGIPSSSFVRKASRYSGTSSESKQMLHPRCTERLLSSKPDAPPSSNNALVF